MTTHGFRAATLCTTILLSIASACDLDDEPAAIVAGAPPTAARLLEDWESANARIGDPTLVGEARQECARQLVVAATALGGRSPRDRPPMPRMLEIMERTVDVARTMEPPDRMRGMIMCANVRAGLFMEDGQFEAAREAAVSVLDEGALDADVLAPVLLVRQHEAERHLGDFEHAVALLDEAESWLGTNSCDFAGDIGEMIHNERVELALAFGTTDRMAYWQRREREEAPKSQPSLQLVERIHRLDVLLASGRYQAAIAEARRLESECTDPRTLVRARYRRVISQVIVALGRGDAVPDDDMEALAELADSAILETSGRIHASWHRANVHIVRGALDAARDDVDRAWSVNSELPPSSEEYGILAAADARLALAGNAPRPELLRVRDRLRHAVEEELASWSKTPMLDEGIGFLNFGTRRETLSTLFLLEAEMAETPDERQAAVDRMFDVVLGADSLGTLARRAAAPTATVEALREELLGPDEGLIAFLPGPRYIHVFALDRKRLVHAAEPVDDLDLLRQGLNENLYSRPQDPGAQAAGALTSGAKLASILLPDPIRERMRGWTRVAFVGSGLLGDVCMPALVVDGSRPLGETKALRNLPSACLALAGARGESTRSDAGAVSLVVANEPAQSFVALPIDEGRARRLLGGPGRLLMGADATAQALAGCTGSETALLVVMAHGTRILDSAQPPCLVMAPSEVPGGSALFTCDDARALRPAPAIVVLASCGASAAPWRAGDEGVNTMGGAFLAAGARSVILARGDLDFDATSALLETLVAEIRRGTDPAEALRIARATTAARPGYAHPYFTALLEVMER